MQFSEKSERMRSEILFGDGAVMSNEILRRICTGNNEWFKIIISVRLKTIGLL